MKKSKETDTIDFFAESKFDDVSPKPSNKETDTIDFFAESKSDGTTKRKPEKDDFVDYFADPKNSAYTTVPRTASIMPLPSLDPSLSWLEDRRWSSEISIQSIETLHIPDAVHWIKESDDNSTHTLCCPHTDSPVLTIISCVINFIFSINILLIISTLSISVTIFNLLNFNESFPFLIYFVILAIVEIIILFFIIKDILSSTWITITKDTLEIERGVSRRHKTIKIERSLQKTKIVTKNGINYTLQKTKNVTKNGINHKKINYKIYMVDDLHKIKIASHIETESKKNALNNLFNQLLKLKITD